MLNGLVGPDNWRKTSNFLWGLTFYDGWCFLLKTKTHMAAIRLSDLSISRSGKAGEMASEDWKLKVMWRNDMTINADGRLVDVPSQRKRR